MSKVGDPKEGLKPGRLLNPTLLKTPSIGAFPTPNSSPSPEGPSLPTPAAASGSCMGCSPGHQSWAQQPLERGKNLEP